MFLGSESEMIVKVVICFTVEPLYLKHASNHKLRLPKLAMLSIRIRHYYCIVINKLPALDAKGSRRQSKPSVLSMLGVAHIIFTGLNF